MGSQCRILGTALQRNPSPPPQIALARYAEKLRHGLSGHGWSSLRHATLHPLIAHVKTKRAPRPAWFRREHGP